MLLSKIRMENILNGEKNTLYGKKGWGYIRKKKDGRERYIILEIQNSKHTRMESQNILKCQLYIMDEKF